MCAARRCVGWVGAGGRSGWWTVQVPFQEAARATGQWVVGETEHQHAPALHQAVHPPEGVSVEARMEVENDRRTGGSQLSGDLGRGGGVDRNTIRSTHPEGVFEVCGGGVGLCGGVVWEPSTHHQSAVAGAYHRPSSGP